MKIPKYIEMQEYDRANIIRKYRFIKKCNENLFLYEEVSSGWKRCFDRWELGGITEMVKPPKAYINPEKRRYR